MQESNDADNAPQPMKKSHAIQGMTCHSCEVLVEMSWKDLPGVKEVKADASQGTVTIVADRDIAPDELAKALPDHRYRLQEEKPSEFAVEEAIRPSWPELTILFLVAMGLAWIISRLSGLAPGDLAARSIGLGTALIFGLVASVSACLAVMSGLLISTTAPFTQKSNKLIYRVAPVLMFLGGRIASYALLGGLLGWLGSRLAFSSTTTAVILAAAAFYMVAVGFDMLHLLPSSWRRYLPGTPKRLSHGIMRQAKKTGLWLPAAVGGATFFLPCGFTQALQAYALTTKSFTTSALILGVFALGTVPGLLAYGLAASSLKGKLGRLVYKVAGALVIVLGLMSLRSSIVLAGLDMPNSQWQTGNRMAAVAMDRDAAEQVVKMQVTNTDYIPNHFTLHVGVPVRWEIDNQATGCGSSLVVSALGINEVLKPGINVLHFTPEKVGQVRITCSMGMYDGRFDII